MHGPEGIERQGVVCNANTNLQALALGLALGLLLNACLCLNQFDLSDLGV